MMERTDMAIDPSCGPWPLCPPSQALDVHWRSLPQLAGFSCRNVGSRAMSARLPCDDRVTTLDLNPFYCTIFSKICHFTRKKLMPV